MNGEVPLDSLILGYGLMLSFAATVVAAWLMPPPRSDIVQDMVIFWRALIPAYVGWVRRGFGLGAPGAVRLWQSQQCR
jgi:hypothetical protein